MAILELNQEISSYYGTFGINFADKEEKEEAHIYGYLGEVYINGTEEYARKKMYGMKG